MGGTQAGTRGTPRTLATAREDRVKTASPPRANRRGRRQPGSALAARFEGIPNVHYGDDGHFACGARGVSEWTITGTTTDGVTVDVRGCDIWTFDSDGRIARKDSFWKIRDT